LKVALRTHLKGVPLLKEGSRQDEDTRLNDESPDQGGGWYIIEY